jgi:hypothetical protein
MKKAKRSSYKVITLQAKIVRYMRVSRKISMREAGRRNRVSDTCICHYEHGRTGLSPELAAELAMSYGFTRGEFDAYMKGKPLPAPNVREECDALLDLLDEDTLRTVQTILSTFALKCSGPDEKLANPYRYRNAAI